MAVIVGLVCCAAAAAAPTAPAFELRDELGNVVRFQPERQQRPALILFWATWCTHCKALMPEVQVIREQFSADELDIYAINVWEDGDPIAYMEAEGLTYPLLLNGGAVAREYGLQGPPGLVLTGEGGTILYVRPDGAANEEMVRLALVGLIERELAPATAALIKRSAVPIR